MGISIQQLPENVAVDLLVRPEFAAMCVSSWRHGAYATGDTIVHTFRALQSIDDPAERAYLSWEIVSSVVELTEMGATAWLNRRAPSQFPIHQATNAQIEDLWSTIRRDGVPPDEIRAFLRLTGPRGFSQPALEAVRVLGRVIQRVELALRDLATFWSEQSGNARWFRHYPATLTPDEAWAIDRTAGDQQRQISAQMATVPDPVEFITHIESERTFSHTVLRMQDVAAAVLLGDAAIQLVMNWLANAGLDPSQPRHERHVFPFISKDLSPEERRSLNIDGNYIFD